MPIFQEKDSLHGTRISDTEDKVCYTPLKDKCDAIRNLESPNPFYPTSAGYLYQYMTYKRKPKSLNGQKKPRKLSMKLKSY